jgi:gamma-glutamyltranspeptidase/glutathione hydrolase/leukotriene-C4 hydrolase
MDFSFGSSLTGARTGIIFNNGMDDFSYPNRRLNYFKLYETPTNHPEPYKRALTSMTPTIVVNEREVGSPNVEMVIGAAGGSKIISAVALALIRYFWLGRDLKQVVDAPRFHHQLIPNQIEYEYGILQQILKELNRKKHKIKRYENRGTIICALSQDNGNIFAVSDFRKDSSGVDGI